jgi:hypothetical protein
MKLFRSWPLYVVLALFLGYLVFSGDESPKEDGESSGKVVTSPTRSHPRVYNPPPVSHTGPPYGAPTASSPGYQAYPGSRYPADPAQSNRYRFRPLEPGDDGQNRYQPSFSFSDRQGGYGPMSGQQRFDPRAPQYPVPNQGDKTYRFRPLDQTRQSRRWSGNQPNPYNRGKYYAPQHRSGPAVGGDSLWAESAPKR